LLIFTTTILGDFYKKFCVCVF